MTTPTPTITEMDGYLFELRDGTSDAIVLEDNMKRHSYEKKGVTIDPKDCWLDLGGYIGTFAIRVISQGAKVVTFEPDPANWEALNRNIELNRLDLPRKKWAIVANNKPTTAPLFINEYRGNYAANTLHPHWTKEKKSVTVTCASFERAKETARTELGGERFCLKMDIEGAEVEILETANFDDIDKISLEYHFSFDPSITRLRAIIDRLERTGFSVALSKKLPDKEIWGWWPRTLQLYGVRR